MEAPLKTMLLVTLIIIIHKIIGILTKKSQQRRHMYYLLERKRKAVEDEGREGVKKRRWKIDTRSFFWEKCMSLGHFEFRKKYRITTEIFNELCETLGPFLKKKDTNMRKAIPVEKRIAIALHCLKSGNEFDTIGIVYNVGCSTVGVILHEFCEIIVKVLRKKYIFLPSVDTDLDDVVSGFETRWNFGGCVGAVDGTHIPIKAPEYLPEDYVNYKNWHSIHALCVVDHMWRFRFVNVGAAGKNADGGVFEKSSLNNLGNDPRIFPKDRDYHFIGDSAFSLVQWLLKPFPQSGLDDAQQHFNYRLSRARMVVECAFGRLKSRWRILLKSCDVQLKNVPNVVLACAILHNMCENQNLGEEKWDKGWTEKREKAEKLLPQPKTQGKSRKATNEGVKKRDKMMKDLYENKNEFYAARNEQDDSDLEY